MKPDSRNSHCTVGASDPQRMSLHQECLLANALVLYAVLLPHSDVRKEERGRT